MFQPQGAKTMLDLHGLSVKEVKKLLEKNFAKITEHEIGELYLITGRDNANSNNTRGVLKKILPKLLKPYCQAILQVNPEMGAYKIILKPKQEVIQLKDILTQVYGDEENCIEYAAALEKKAAENDIESLLALATIHLHKAIEGFDNVDKGIELLLKAKQLGSLDADVQLGILNHEGFIVKQHHKKAYQYFLYAAEKGHPVAQYYIGVCFLHGKGIKYNNAKSVKWMKKSADQGDACAQDALGDFYLLGKITNKNMTLGIEYKTKAAQQGLANAEIDLARCYATGYGVEKNYKTAFRYYLSAAQSKKPYAIYQVGSYLLTGRTELPPDPTAAFDWFLKAAELNDGDGQAQVAYLYLFGIGVKQKLEKGIEWALKAVEQKNTHGYYVLASAYLKGLGVKQDGLQAYNYMKLAAENGYPDAQYELGILLTGKKVFNDIPENFDEGLQWLEKAMRQGNNDAAEIMEYIFKKHREPKILTAMLNKKMQALLKKPEITPVESKSSMEISDTKTNVNSSTPAFFKPVQEEQQSEQLENNEQSSYWCSVI